MKYTKKIYIERQTTERVFISAGFDNRPRFFCERCAAQSEFVSLIEAAKIFRLSEREIARAVETGEVHFWENDGGHLFVCRSSLHGKILKTLVDNYKNKSGDQENV